MDFGLSLYFTVASNYVFLASYFVLSTCLKFILHLECQLSVVLSFSSLPGNSGVA